MDEKNAIEFTQNIMSELVLPIIKDLALPVIKKTISKNFLNKEEGPKFEDNLSKYLVERYEKFLIIDTLAFPNKQTLFKNLYQPLTLEIKGSLDKEEEHHIDCYPSKLLPFYQRVIIEDTAGMGKSTVSKKLFLSIIEEKKGIPFLIELRQINPKNTLIKEIQKQLSRTNRKPSQDIINKLLLEGSFVFLFDGFDEIPLTHREFVTIELRKFIDDHPNSFFLITSRFEDALASFGDFQSFKIQPLKKIEAYELIKKYDCYSYRPISNNLISKLEKGVKEGLEEYLTNPFLVSLLYKSYEYKKDIPIKKSQFYRQVYDALFEAHDLSKEGYLVRDKYSNLHIDDFERVLRYIGFFTAIENQVEYDKNQIISVIDKAKRHLPDLKFKSSDFLKDLLKTVPLFKQDGSQIKWSHKSLQDFFCAKFIWIDSNNNQAEILRKIYLETANARFRNMLDIFYELDPKTFDITFTTWLLEDFIKYVDSLIATFPTINPKHLTKRASFLFTKESKVVFYKNIRNRKGLLSDKLDRYMQELNYKINYARFIDIPDSRVQALIFTKNISNYITIIELLQRRNPTLVQSPKYESSISGMNLSNVTFDKLYDIEIDTESFYNSPTNFDYTTRIIQRGTYLRYDVAIKTLESIKKKTLPRKRNDFLNW